MRIWIINCPNNARFLKGICLVLCLVLCLTIIQLQLSQSSDSLKSSLTNRKLILHPNMDQSHYICINFFGRLGNQMYSYASAFAIGKAKGLKMRIGQQDLIARYFNLSADVRSGNYCERTMNRWEKFHCSYDPRMMTINNYYNWQVGPYLQSWKYFINFTDEVRKEFTFQTDIANKARSIFLKVIQEAKNYRKGSNVYIGVHIRRGDMADLQRYSKDYSVNRGYNVASKKYIMNAMNYFLKKHHQEHVTFVICSDDTRWVKRQFGRYNWLLSVAIVERNTAAVDLAILAQCNHTIMTTGTYSWWAAWLAGGTTVYYKHFIRDGSPLRDQFSSDYSDYYYPGWIGME